MDSVFLKILLIVAISSVKFVGGPITAYNLRVFNFVEIVCYTVLGGMMGVVIVSYCSPYITRARKFVKHLFVRKKKIFVDTDVDVNGKVKFHYDYVITEKKKNVFTPRTRKLVRFWKKYGLIGIAAITPVVLSIPVGSYFATRLARDRERVFLYMFASLLSWSVLITAILYKLIPVSPDLIK